MVPIDIKTIFLICCLGGVLTVIAFLVYKRIYGRKESTLSLYVAARVLLSIAFFLFACREILGGRLYVDLANTCLLFGISGETYALFHAGRGFKKKPFLVASASTALLAALFQVALCHGPHTWVIAMSFLLFCQLAAAGSCMVFNRSMNSTQKITGFYLLFLSAVMMARGMNALLRGGSVVLLTADYIQLLSYISFFLIIYMLPMLYLLILREQDHRAVAESEEKYRLLFTNAFSGIFLSELVEDENGTTIDYSILKPNPAFRAQTGLKPEDVAGRRISEVLPHIAETPVFDIFDRVMRTGEAASFEEYSVTLRRHFLIHAYRVDSRHIGTMFLDITGIKRTEEELQQTVREKQSLLRELQHRVKNSFAMIISLVRLSSMSFGSREAQSALDSITARVRALSELYGQLDAADSYGEVRLDEYCTRIASAMAGMSKNIALDPSLAAMSIPMKEAATLGLILTELLTNAVKYAFPDGRRGTISMRLERCGSGILLEVADDGIGLPDGSGASQQHGLGLTLVRTLVRQLDGTFTVENSGGTRCLVEFTLPDEDA
jgi:PAS domain S-box-containing protein